MSAASYVAAFRTHFWSDPVERLARRMQGACEDGGFIVLADETHGPVPAPFAKIAHTDRLGALGLPRAPKKRSLWFNCDYGLYVLRQALPGHDYYVMSEYDVAVNAPLGPLVRAAADRGLDLVAHDCAPAPLEWHWRANADAWFAEPWRAFIYFVVVSGRAVDRLLERRRAMAARVQAGEPSAFCESFVISAAREEGLTWASVSEFVDASDLNFRPHLHIDDPKANRPGSLVHSVLGGERIISAMLAEAEGRRYFKRSSPLRRALSHEPFDTVAPALYAKLVHEGDTNSLELLRALTAKRGLSWPPGSAPTSV